MIGDFTVDCHVVSALWVNLVGHKFDAKLSPRALASRVRRYRPSKEIDEIGHYQLEALGSFEPYFNPYRRWRDDGIKAMENSVKNGESIVALTLDVSNFYHSIDPKFFINKNFLDYIGLNLSAFELIFSAEFSSALSTWSNRCLESMKKFGCSDIDSDIGGIPIGISIVRVISNSVLTFLDNQIEEGLSPIYYARYVDDLFIVIKDNSDIQSQEDLWEFLQGRILAFKRDSETGDVTLQLPGWGGSSNIKLQGSKQKSFFLSGRSGLDLLANIASQIREVSSERRLMPLPEHLDQTQSAKTLASTETADEADSLRRADGLTLKRLGWSVLLRSVSTLARDLNSKDWVEERNNFYEFAHEHVIRPDKILEQLDHLPKLFSLAVSLGDWKQALRIYRETVDAIYKLEKATVGRPMKINGRHAPVVTLEIWEQTRDQVQVFFHEALIRSYPIEQNPLKVRPFASLLALLDLTPTSLEELALLSRETDWARMPYREHLRKFAQRKAPKRAEEETLYGRYSHEKMLTQFLDRTEVSLASSIQSRVSNTAMSIDDEHASLLPFLFPTRPYSPEEIALYLPDECVFAEPATAAFNWAEYTRAVRGVWVRSNLADETDPTLISEDREKGMSDDSDRIPPKAFLSGSERPRAVRLGITSFSTSDNTWAAAASGTPDLSPLRYKNLARIINQAVNEPFKPDYLILPELAIPEKWISTIAGRLSDAGISLIAGLDYVRHNNNKIDSSAVLVLRDSRLGYPSSLQVRQRKELPAPSEEENLLVSHGQAWKDQDERKKPVYIHDGFHFGVLVCSELQNIDYRSAFQGHVDCVIILSWNKDIETFAALVDSASFDVHAYIALVNNLRYGDSRVRRPAKQSHLRDVCRIRGGLNNQLVVVEIDPSNLRAQQSRVKRWPRRDDNYKPAPEGFRISDLRWTVPS